MVEKETVIDFSQFPLRGSSDFEDLPVEEYGTYDLCTIYILEATSHPSGKWFLSQIPCEDTSGGHLCGGGVELIRYDLPSQIKWKCKECKKHGKIINFEDTEWDISQLSDDEQQQIIAAYIAPDDPMNQLEELPEDELQDFLGFVDQYMDNIGVGEAAREESGGLSSKQLYQLLDSDWQSPDSPLKLNTTLPQDEIDQSLFFHNARAFLRCLNEQGSFPSTGSGNLKRKIVSSLMKQLRWPEGYIEEIQDQYTVINEKQIWLLHVTRILLELSGLIYLTDEAYYPDDQFTELLEEDRAGELYCQLFFTYFKEMNLGYISDFDEVMGLQDTLPYTFYKLSSSDKKWKPYDDSMSALLLSSLYDQLIWDGFGQNYIYNLLFKPLTYFGLIETRYTKSSSDNPYIPPNEFRKTTLFNQLFIFDVEGEPQNGTNGNVIPLNDKAASSQNGYFRKKEQEKEPEIYQLKFSLDSIKPPIWRRVLVPSGVLLPDLHKIIQSSMGWMNGHLHQFEKNRQCYSKPAPDWPNNDIDYRNVRVNKLLKKEKQKITYTYDFGDGWRHTILLEKILPVDSEISYPVCIKGKRNCPPEDCGGPWGYQQMLEAVNDPSHPEHDMYKDWIGPNFDPERFDKDKINELLQKENYGVLEVF